MRSKSSRIGQGAAQADLEGGVGIDQPFLNCPFEDGGVAVLLAEELVPGVRVGVQLDQRDGTVLAGARPEQRKCDGVVASQGHRKDACVVERRRLASTRE